MNAQHKAALITGASSGIGLRLAHEFAGHGFDLVMVARDEQRLSELADALQGRYGIKATVIAADLADAAAPARIARRVAEEGMTIDVLVNNAGFGQRGRFSEISLERHLEMVQVNVAALLALTRLFLPEMLARGSGRILNVSSTAAFQPGPDMAVYYAAKSFVLFLSEALSAEVAGSGVTITCLCPGPTATRWAARAGMERSMLFRVGVMDAAAVARLAYEATISGRRLIVPGVKNRLLTFLTRLTPRGMLLRIVALLQSCPPASVAR